MSRARNDRNVVKFGPAPSSIEEETRKLRREQQQVEFRLSTPEGLARALQSSGLLSSIPTGPVGPTLPDGEAGPIVVPNSLDPLIAENYPFVLNSLGDVYTSTYLADNRQKDPVVKFYKFADRIYIHGRNNVYGLNRFDPSQTEETINFPGSNLLVPLISNETGGANNPIFAGRFTVAGRTDFRSSIFIYDPDNDTYSSFTLPAEDIRQKITDFIVANPPSGFSEVDTITFGQGQSNPITLDAENFFGFFTHYSVRYMLTGGSLIRNYQIIAYHVVNAETLERTDYFIAGGVKQGASNYPLGVVVNASRKGSGGYAFSAYIVSPFDSLSGRNSTLYYAENLHTDSPSLSVVSQFSFANLVNKRQVDLGTTTMQGTFSFDYKPNPMVYMDWNRNTAAWEIHKINKFGVKSIIADVFPPQSDDQPVSANTLVAGAGISPYNATFVTETKPNTVCGVSHIDGNRYFVYGSVLKDYGETFEGSSVRVAVPAIWYYDGFSSRRVWTLPDTEEYPLQTLGVLRTTVHNPSIEPVDGLGLIKLIKLRNARLQCAVTYLEFDGFELLFLVRVGKTTMSPQGDNIIYGANESRLYRVDFSGVGQIFS